MWPEETESRETSPPVPTCDALVTKDNDTAGHS